MITWLVGENSFEVREALKKIETNFNGLAEKIDGSELALAQLPDILMGVSLFSSERLVIIRDITTNSFLWEKISDWLPRINDDIHVVFIDTKPDKRTTSYKALKAAAEIQEYPAWTERDTSKAEQWLDTRAKNQNVKIGRTEIRQLVNRVGVDQWKLASALEMLSLADEITSKTIDDIIPANPTENVFQLLDLALDGNGRGVAQSIKTLSLQEDPYAIFGLVSSQVLTLAAVTFAESPDAVAKDFAVHPFVASKLTRHAKSLGKAKVAHIVELCAQTDADFKRSKAEPWLLIERFLLNVAAVAK